MPWREKTKENLNSRSGYFLPSIPYHLSVSNSNFLTFPIMSFINTTVRSPIEQYVRDEHTIAGISKFSPSVNYPAFSNDLDIAEGHVSESDDDDDKTEPLSIFPISVSLAYEIPLTIPEPQYADHWPIGFIQTGQWPHIWRGAENNIDRYLRYGRHMRTGDNVFWTPETQFKGIRWRLVIDSRKDLHSLPIFVEGMTLSFQHCNTRNFRYIIDHCAYKDEVSAYLKVFCFRFDHYICESWTSCPPIILAVPLTHCNVRDHPNSLLVPRKTTNHSKTSICSRLGRFSFFIFQKLKAVF